MTFDYRYSSLNDHYYKMLSGMNYAFKLVCFCYVLQLVCFKTLLTHGTFLSLTPGYVCRAFRSLFVLTSYSVDLKYYLKLRQR